MKLKAFLLSLPLLVTSTVALSDELNIYSARKEALIRPLLDKFSEEHNIKVNLVTGKADALLTRMQSEGEFSPADIILTTDVGRLERAREMGLTTPVDFAVLNQHIAENLRHRDGHWYALTIRARPIMYHPERVNPEQLSGILELAGNTWKNRICIRSSGNIYNQSMVAAMMVKYDEKVVQDWASGFVKNFARKPKGGDRDQIKAVVAGECDIAIANTYYLGAMLADSNKANADIAKQLKVFWPDQEGEGTHINVSGIAAAKHAPNAKNVKLLMEYMISEESQRWYAETNHEYPVRGGVATSELLQGFGDFKAEQVPMAKVGELNKAAVKLMDKAGWK